MKLFNKKPYRITVLRQLGGIGDSCMILPVYRGLKVKYPGCRLTVATTWAYGSGALPDLLKHNPFVDEVVRVEPDEFAPSHLRREKREFRHVPNDRIPVCVQDTDLVIELNVVCAMVESRTQPNVTQHRTDIWCDAAGVNPSDKRPVLVLTADEMRQGRDWCDKHLGEGKRVGVVLSAMSPVRDWPHAHQFAIDLHRMGYKAVTLDRIQQAADHVPAVRGQRIRAVAAILAHLDAVVTPDTGLLHLAGTVGTPVLGLFGSTEPAVRMRYYAGHYTVPQKMSGCGWSPCWYNNHCLKSIHPADHAVCMKRVTPDLVLDELERMLERFEAPARTGTMVTA